MMIIIIEGNIGAGKTTLSSKPCEVLGGVGGKIVQWIKNWCGNGKILKDRIF